MGDIRSLRVLLLEDSRDDAELILHELRGAGFVLIVDRVETESDFFDGLNPAPDLILADYRQPQFDALRALELVRRRGLDVPVIVVTGALGDEAAVECVRRGACDYLLKDRLARLGPAVVYAMEQKRTRDAKAWAEQALRNSEARKTAILEAAVDAIITIDQRGMVESVNPAAERLFGYAAGKIRGQNVSALMPEPYRQEHDRYLERYLRTGFKKIIGIGREVVGRKADGTTFPMELTVSEVRLGHRRIFTGIMRDISERKKAEHEMKLAAELRARNLELARSNQILNQFASMLSNELEQRLRGIHDHATSLAEDHASQLDNTGRAELQTLIDLTRRIGESIDSLLELSRVALVDLDIEETDLNEVLGEIVASLRDTMLEQGVEMTVRGTLPTVRCDRVLIDRVFRNLITNAIAFNDKREKSVEVEWVVDSVDPPEASSGSGGRRPKPGVFHIRDNGVGIPQEQFSTIFEVCQRPNSRDTSVAKTCSGLAVVKKIIDRHGGRVWVESTYDQWTTVCFTLGEPGQS